MNAFHRTWTRRPFESRPITDLGFETPSEVQEKNNPPYY